MSKSIQSERLVTLKCPECGQKNYHTGKNKKKVERKLEYRRYCKWCRKHTVHKEAKLR